MVRLDSWAVFLAAFAVASAVFPAWAVLPAARYAAAYCFCSFRFCHRREMGLDASWGFQLALCPPVLDTAVSVAHSLLQTAFPQVARLDAGIFLLYLPDLAVDGCACLLNGAGQRIGVGLSRTLIGNRVPGGIQPVRRLVRLADGPLQLRLGLVCLGKLQSGGWATRCRLALPIGSALFPALLFGCCLFPVQFRTVYHFSSGACRVAGCGMVLLRRSVRGIGGFPRDQVDRYRPVTGYLLRLLFGGFPFFQGASPPGP